MEKGDSLFIAIHFKPEEWNNIPANVGFCHLYNSDESRNERELIRSNIISIQDSNGRFVVIIRLKRSY